MRWVSRVCLCCVCDGVPRRSLVVASIVGTILNLINQGDALLNGTAINVTKIILTYAVPYCVSTYGAVSFQMATMRAKPVAYTDGDERATH